MDIEKELLNYKSLLSDIESLMDFNVKENRKFLKVIAGDFTNNGDSWRTYKKAQINILEIMLNYIEDRKKSFNEEKNYD